MRHLVLYPQRATMRLWYLLADLATVACAAACLYLGRAVYDSVLALSVIADAAITTGQRASVIVGEVQRQVNSLPFVGPSLKNALNPVQRLPRTLQDFGVQELATIGHLATLLGIAVAGIPLLILALTYLPWRVRVVRNASALASILRQSGASVREPTEKMLAARALYALPYARLARYAHDPIGEWRSGRYDNLARAALAVEGLDPWHTLDRTATVTVPPRKERWTGADS